jgi:hypothetical protein
LVESGHLSSAGVLLRAQLEATIRAAWLLCVASDEWVEGYLEKARSNPHKDPGSTPSVDDMIRGIESKASQGLAPKPLAPQLRALKDGAWHSLNSFVHSGLHPTLLQFEGYSVQAGDAVLRNANSLCVIAAMLIALLSGDEEVAEGVKNLQPTFFDCCTPATPASASLASGAVFMSNLDEKLPDARTARDIVLRGGGVLPRQLSRSEEGRWRRRGALREAMVRG